MRAMHRLGGRRWSGIAAAAGCAVLLAGCGSDPPVIKQAASASPLTGSRVDVTLTGDATVTIPDPTNGVTFTLDEGHLLKVRLVVRSTGTATQTVAVKATLFDQGGTVIGDATGGTLNVVPGQDTTFDLSGPTPNGTIARATFEVHTTASPSSTGP